MARLSYAQTTVRFTITDAARQFRDVAIEDLVIAEAGVPQTLETFEEAVTPVSMIASARATPRGSTPQ